MVDFGRANGARHTDQTEYRYDYLSDTFPPWTESTMTQSHPAAAALSCRLSHAEALHRAESLRIETEPWKVRKAAS